MNERCEETEAAGYRASTGVLTHEAGDETARGPRCIVCSEALDEVASAGELFDTRFGIDGCYEARRCSQCGLEQLFPIPSAPRIKQLYESYYNFGGERGTLYTALREWLFSSVLYRLWIWLDGDVSFHARKGQGRLLDIGCNEGRGLKFYLRNGFQVEGLELNENAVEVARESGFKVYTDAVEDFVAETPYDVVVLSNVLEHSLDPKAMLLSVRRLLKPGGEVWISCPNGRSWMRSTFGASWINWHVPFHISHFSSQSLRHLLSVAGFTQAEVSQITPALWVGSSVIAWVFARRGISTRQLRNPFLIVWLLLLARFVSFPLLCAGNWLGRGDCLVAVARQADAKCSKEQV